MSALGRFCCRSRRLETQVAPALSRSLGLPVAPLKRLRCGRQRLPVNQFGLLARPYGARLHKELLPRSALAERQGMDPTTLTRSLKPLETAGLIGNGVDPADQRVRV